MIAILVFGILILIHEAGHFTAAKLSGVKVNEFSLGMGPAIAKIHRGETQYSLRIFPIGGFVSMEGEDDVSADARSFQRAKLWKRIVIVCSGAFMNILLGFILAIVFVLVSPVHSSTVVNGFYKGSLSNTTGLKAGDRIVAIDGSRVHISTDIMYDLMVINKKTVSVTVERNNQIVKLNDVKFPIISAGGTSAMEYDFSLKPEKKTVLTVLRQSYYWTVATVKVVWVTLYLMFKGQYSVSDLSGPVGVSATMGQAASAGLLPLLFVTILITVNLGVVNLLPLPALDGGRLFFLILEGIRRKPISREVEGNIHFAGFVLLMMLVLFVTFNDLARLNVFRALGGLFK